MAKIYSDELDFALSLLLEQYHDIPLTSEDIRRETIDLVCTYVHGVDRAEVERTYDEVIPRQIGEKAWLG